MGETNKKIKDYLNSEETFDMVKIGRLVDELDIMINTWGDRGNLTKEELKALRQAKTWANKAWDTIMDRMNDKQLVSYKKRQDRMSIQLLDRYSFNRALDRLNNTLMQVYKKEQHYFDLCGEVMEKHCLDCYEHPEECPFAREFYTNDVQEPILEDHEGKHCKYSYTLDQKVKELMKRK